MLSPDILQIDAKWLRTATEDQLREFIRFMDEQPASHRKEELLKAFDEECNRRAARYYESINNGEWI